MRIADSTAYLSFLRDLQRTQEQALDAQMKVTSGKKVLKPSDDPSAASDIIRLSGEKAEEDQFARNIEAARSRLDAADAVLDSVETMLQRVINLGQSSLGNAAPASAFTTEIDGLRDQILSASNTAHGGRFIFGGSVTNSQPFLKAPDSSVSYQGNSNAVLLQVGRSVTLQTQIPGNEVFTGTVDVFDAMSDLVTAIQAGDRDAIDTQLQRLQQGYTQVSTARSRIGGFVNVADSQSSHLISAGLIRAEELDHVQSADPAEAITQLTLSQSSLQATLAVGARIAQMSLLDYLS